MDTTDLHNEMGDVRKEMKAHREVTQHSFIQNRHKDWSAVKSELIELVKLVSWFLLDTTDLYREMRL